MPVEFFEVVFLIAEQFDVIVLGPAFRPAFGPGIDALLEKAALTIGRPGEREISGEVNDSDVGRVEDVFGRVWTNERRRRRR